MGIGGTVYTSTTCLQQSIFETRFVRLLATVITQLFEMGWKSGLSESVTYAWDEKALIATIETRYGKRRVIPRSQ